MSLPSNQSVECSLSIGFPYGYDSVWIPHIDGVLSQDVGGASRQDRESAIIERAQVEPRG
jgi:hypothetical protein